MPIQHSVNVVLEIASKPDFIESVHPDRALIYADDGGTVLFQVSVSPLNGFAGNVGLSIVGIPDPKITVVFDPPTIIGGSGTSALSISAPPGLAKGIFNLGVFADEI